MAEEDYEIDVYGDAQDGGQEQQHAGAEDYGDNTHMDGAPESGDADHEAQHGNGSENGEQGNDQPTSSSSAPQQGVKRKPELDDRPVDPNATAALLISELQWWNTEDEVRNWVHDADCEDELKEITFSEHKVNGKSKGCAITTYFTIQTLFQLTFLVQQTSLHRARLQPGCNRNKATHRVRFQQRRERLRSQPAASPNSLLP